MTTFGVLWLRRYVFISMMTFVSPFSFRNIIFTRSKVLTKSIVVDSTGFSSFDEPALEEINSCYIDNMNKIEYTPKKLISDYWSIFDLDVSILNFFFLLPCHLNKFALFFCFRLMLPKIFCRTVLL